MVMKYAGPIEELGGNIGRFAGDTVRQAVMIGSEEASAATEPRQVALWVKEAVARLDILAAPEERERIMHACGSKCACMNPRPTRMAAERRKKFPSEQAFLEAEARKPSKGTRLELQGALLHFYYTPRAYRGGLRCYCSLVQGLPEGETASLTYCQCARSFVKHYWEAVLGRDVAVDLAYSAISGADECKFIVHL